MVARINKGFSLVELLVAMSLLSMIIYLGSLSYASFSGSWQKINSRIHQNIKAARNVMLLRKSVISTAAFLLQNEERKPILLFNGTEHGFQSFTASPLFHNKAAVYQVVFIASLDRPGFGSLVYREASNMAPFTVLGQTLEFEYELTIAKDIQQFKIGYFGWGNLLERNQELGDEIKVKRWFREYNAGNTLILPEAITLKWKDEKQNDIILFFSLIDASYRLISREIGENTDA